MEALEHREDLVSLDAAIPVGVELCSVATQEPGDRGAHADGTVQLDVAEAAVRVRVEAVERLLHLLADLLEREHAVAVGIELGCVREDPGLPRLCATPSAVSGVVPAAAPPSLATVATTTPVAIRIAAPPALAALTRRRIGLASRGPVGIHERELHPPVLAEVVFDPVRLPPERVLQLVPALATAREPGDPRTTQRTGVRPPTARLRSRVEIDLAGEGAHEVGLLVGAVVVVRAVRVSMPVGGIERLHRGTVGLPLAEDREPVEAEGDRGVFADDLGEVERGHVVVIVVGTPGVPPELVELTVPMGVVPAALRRRIEDRDTVHRDRDRTGQNGLARLLE